MNLFIKSTKRSDVQHFIDPNDDGYYYIPVTRAYNTRKGMAECTTLQRIKVDQNAIKRREDYENIVRLFVEKIQYEGIESLSVRGKKKEYNRLANTVRTMAPQTSNKLLAEAVKRSSSAEATPIEITPNI